MAQWLPADRAIDDDVQLGSKGRPLSAATQTCGRSRFRCRCHLPASSSSVPLLSPGL
jgi:hypothetical protein